ncbi:MAG TPA: amino acid adenylation domain-containing protein, partial [Thermoanaerobaculia bacterium]|nr:amino acid adenylation domain-containing protein [Thermoanaerobaculia bacterium]
EDSGAGALVVQGDLRDRFGEVGIPVLAMEDLLTDESAAAPERTAGPEHLAYVIYTSGSTGRPKGVMVEHRQLSAYVGGVLQRMELPDGASFATVSTLAADLGNTSIFSALASGGALHVIARDRLLNAAGLADVLGGRGVDCLKIVPSHLAALLGEGGAAGVLPRRLLVTGGEACPRTLVERVRELAPGCRVLNHYGPTETTVGVLTFPTWSEEDRGGAILPLGRPLPGTQGYVVDRNLQPLPAGVPGEMLVGGAQVSRGYLGRPDLTAEKLIPDPFGGEGGARLYRTGDLARRRPDGAVEFLGRIDQQVKVRGYRVEPGEVESVLAARPGVRAAAVLAHPDSAGGNRLVAYIAGAVPADLDRRLPAHMVPSAFVVLPELPLTPNGKVDRQTLAGIPPDVAPSVREHVPPRNAAEEALAGIWTEILGVGRVGAQDDFFALGGHSLLGIRLLSRVEDRFGVRLPVRTLFQATTLGEMAERIAEARGEGKPEPIGRAPRDGGPLPLSFAQERLWFLDLFAPGNAAYNVPSFVRLRGPLDAAALRRTLTEVTRRHESLRTTFVERAGVPLQVIAPPGEMNLPLVSCGGEEEMLRLADEEARRPFDLARGPLFRATLLRLGDEDHALLLNIHHIVSDGWSRGVLIREVAVLYDALSAGRPSPLPELPIQYADYAAWQRNRLQGETLKTDLAFWRERLAGTPPLEFPADRPRPPKPSFRGGLLDLDVPEGVPGRLRALCREEEVTSYMALLAAFQTLLLRYSGQTDFAVGSPVANRTRTEVEGVIGFFVNTLALRVDLSGGPTFRELLRRVREVAVEAFSHEEMPFERIVEDLHPDREAGRNPVFQVLLALQSQPWPALAMGGLDVSVIEAGTGTAKVDLNLAWRETGDQLLGVLEYSSDLFDDPSAARMARHAVALLRGALEAPDHSLEDLPMLSPEEGRQLLVEWNVTPAESLGIEVLHQRFAAQAARAPEAVAVVCEGATLTYAELDRRANQIANHLIGLGVVPCDLVGLHLERSPEMVAAILGVLKAGAAYVPLDPEYPAERLAFMVEDSGVAVTLTEESLAGIAGDSSDPEVPVSAEYPAYVIYTSGSTGRPKGVIVRHGNATRLFSATDRWFGFGPEDVWTLFHSYAFDFSVWEIWGALLYGGRLVVVPYWVSRSPAAFYELVRDERVTVLNQTPSAFRQFLWAEKGELALRYVIFGGEALEPASLAPWFERHGDERPRLVNMYGITETTVHVTYRVIGREDVASAVGRPIPDLGIYLADPALNLVPLGVPGEILVGGAGLALGYLNRPELTAERFIPNPFGEPGSRLYRSGDLARRLPDGDLEYLGRIDHQVKIRGFRIELGEIEAALVRHPAVREAVVVAWEALPGDTRLSAFVVPETEPAPDAAGLRAHVAATLPAYMAPSAFHFLESLPLTPNGKVDRKALGRMTTATNPEEREYVAPRNALEELLVPLWEEVLGVERVGVTDDFFALGGHSLLAVRLLSKVEDLFGVRLTVQALFHSTTLGAMAERIAEEMTAQSGEDFLQQLSAESEEYEESSRG